MSIQTSPGELCRGASLNLDMGYDPDEFFHLVINAWSAAEPEEVE